jgi:hypothetical protein
MENENIPIEKFTLSAQHQHLHLLKDAAAISGIPIEMTPIFDSQLREICVALGWQGGTYHGVLEEIKRLKTFEANAKDPRQGDHC